MTVYNLTEIKGIGNSKVKKLKKAKIKTIEDLANSTVEYLTKIDGVGQVSAKKWIHAAKTKLMISPSDIKTKSKTNVISSPSIISSESGIGIDQSLIQNIQSDISQIFNRLESIEARLSKIEKKGFYSSQENIKSSKGTKLEDIGLFSNIVKESIEEITTGRFGINKISLKELYNSINKDYYITKERFSKYLLELHSRNKIQLEPGLIDQDFYIEDNYGNIYKVIRILE